MNTNENIINYKYENSNLNAITVNNNGKNVTYSLGGGSGTSGTFDSKIITANGTYNASNDSLDGYDEVTVNVPDINIQDEKDVEIITNTTTVVTPDAGYDAINKINLDVNVEAYMKVEDDYSRFITFKNTNKKTITAICNFDFDGSIIFARITNSSTNKFSRKFTAGTTLFVDLNYSYVYNVFILDKNTSNLVHMFYIDMNEIYNP